MPSVRLTCVRIRTAVIALACAGWPGAIAAEPPASFRYVWTSMGVMDPDDTTEKPLRTAFQAAAEFLNGQPVLPAGGQPFLVSVESRNAMDASEILGEKPPSSTLLGETVRISQLRDLAPTVGDLVSPLVCGNGPAIAATYADVKAALSGAKTTTAEDDGEQPDEPKGKRWDQVCEAAFADVDLRWETLRPAIERELEARGLVLVDRISDDFAYLFSALPIVAGETASSQDGRAEGDAIRGPDGLKSHSFWAPTEPVAEQLRQKGYANPRVLSPEQIREAKKASDLPQSMVLPCAAFTKARLRKHLPNMLANPFMYQCDVVVLRKAVFETLCATSERQNALKEKLTAACRDYRNGARPAVCKSFRKVMEREEKHLRHTWLSPEEAAAWAPALADSGPTSPAPPPAP